ncbi:MAG TPA: alpha/beta hydrolase, partial [Planctomycetota bacterium]|nr:alpha/beta hydrolase [Planctomycetota bacterium]
MSLSPLGLLRAVGGFAAASGPSRRLTPFRETLFQEGVLRDLTIDGRRYCVADLGQGPPVVLVHGLGGSLYDWRHLIRPLAEHRRVIAVDLLGSGESDLPVDEDYSIPAQARRLRGLLEAMNVVRSDFVGNSYGGGIILRFAEDWPERVTRLVLMNSVCYGEHIPAYVTLARLPFAGLIAEVTPLGKATRTMIANSHRTIAILEDAELENYTSELRRPGRRRALVDVLRAIVPSSTVEFEARLRNLQA